MEFELTRSKFIAMAVAIAAVTLGVTFKTFVHPAVWYFMCSGLTFIWLPEFIGTLWGLQRAARGVSDSTSSPGCIVSACGWFMMGFGILIMLLS